MFVVSIKVYWSVQERVVGRWKHCGKLRKRRLNAKDTMEEKSSDQKEKNH